MESGQGGCRGQEADDVATGTSHPTDLSDDVFWAPVQPQGAVSPAGGSTVGSGGVNDPGMPIFNELHRPPGGDIGQVEKRQAGRVEVFFPFRRVLVPGSVDVQWFEIDPSGESLLKLKASDALPAVDKGSWLIHICVSSRTS